MTTQKFEAIKAKIAEETEKNLKAKGVCENIVEDWKKRYGFSTVEEATRKLNEITQEREEKTARKEKLMNKLENLHDWSLE